MIRHSSKNYSKPSSKDTKSHQQVAQFSFHLEVRYNNTIERLWPRTSLRFFLPFLKMIKNSRISACGLLFYLGKVALKFFSLVFSRNNVHVCKKLSFPNGIFLRYMYSVERTTKEAFSFTEQRTTIKCPQKARLTSSFKSIRPPTLVCNQVDKYRPNRYFRVH